MADEYYKLKPGQKLYDSEGQEIITGTTKDELVYKKTPGEKLYDSEGNTVTGPIREKLKGQISNAEKKMILRSLKNVKKKNDGVISFEELEKNKKNKPKIIEAAKGGMVKKYMGGGSVHKKKNKMATTKGWGASRKT